jgi:TRAP-type C4-dicarboxylate transport system permease small subunit
MAVEVTIVDILISYISRFFMILAGVALLLLVLLATSNVALRLFHVPFAGTYEIVSFLGALVTAGALGHTQRRKDHIRVDIITAKYFPRMKRMVYAISHSMSALLFSIAAWQIYRWGEKIRLSGELSETLQLKFHPFIYGVAAGFALLTLVLLLDTARAILYKREDEL